MTDSRLCAFGAHVGSRACPPFRNSWIHPCAGRVHSACPWESLKNKKNPQNTRGIGPPIGRGCSSVPVSPLSLAPMESLNKVKKMSPDNYFSVDESGCNTKRLLFQVPPARLEILVHHCSRLQGPAGSRVQLAPGSSWLQGPLVCARALLTPRRLHTLVLY